MHISIVDHCFTARRIACEFFKKMGCVFLLLIVVFMSLFIISCESSKSNEIQSESSSNENTTSGPVSDHYEQYEQSESIIEIKNLAWSETGFSLDILFNNKEYLGSRKCHQSKKALSPCLMTMDSIYRSPKENPYQLKVSDGLIEVVPYLGGDFSEMTEQEQVGFLNQKRESFREFLDHGKEFASPGVYGVWELDRLMQEALVWARDQGQESNYYDYLNDGASDCSESKDYRKCRFLSCTSSKEAFSSCLIAMDTLYRSPKENPYQLKVSGGLIEVVPYFRGDFSEMTEQDQVEFLNQKRESFYQFSGGGKEFARPGVYGAREFRQLMQEAQLWAKEKIGAQDQARVAGEAFAFFLKELDPRSGFFPLFLEDMIASRYMLNDQFGIESGLEVTYGIGAKFFSYELGDGNLTGAVGVDPVKSSSAMIAGLKRGDLILEVDGEDVRAMELGDIVEKIRGPVNTRVSLKVLDICDGEKKDVDILRLPQSWTQSRSVQLMNYGMEDSRFMSIQRLEPLIPQICGEKQNLLASSQGKRVYYFPLSSFLDDKGAVCNGFKNAQEMELNDPNSIGMIIDLRGNGGGVIDTAECMLDSIIQSDEPILRHYPIKKGEIWGYLENFSSFTEHSDVVYDCKKSTHGLYDRNIVVLMDENSASASEIFAGNIQDMKRGYVVGQRSYGKGSIQTERSYVLGDLRQPLYHKYTSSIFTTNSGRSPQDYGIIPDFAFSRTGKPIEYDMDDPDFKVEPFWVFENKPWEQNRPNEVAAINHCIGRKNEEVRNLLKQRMQEDERYSRPLMSDYQLEFAKNVLSCMHDRDQSFLSSEGQKPL